MDGIDRNKDKGVEGFTMIFDQHLQLIHSIGDDVKTFRTSTHSFLKKGMLLKEIDWTQLFTTIPNTEENYQVLTNLNQEEILFCQTPYHLEISSLSIIINCFNLSPIKSCKDRQQYFQTDKNHLIMESNSMKRVSDIINKVSLVDSTILLLGESGVGKSAIAKLIHHISKRSDEPFISVNCGSLPETLIETEFFGYEAGSFTGGSKSGKTGLFEAANKGTIFLDEVSELPLNMQTKLLEVLQENKIRKVGGTTSKSIDVRIISATNKDLYEMTKNKTFREDLYYRLNVVPITIPPLRERREDITFLIEYFLSKYNMKYSFDKKLEQSLKSQLLNYHWPGNIRELENTIERIVVTNTADFDGFNRAEGSHHFHLKKQQIIPLKLAKKAVEKELIAQAYYLYGSTYKVAKVLEVDQSTVVKKMKEYNIQPNNKYSNN